MEKIEKTYIKDKVSGTYESLALEEKVNAEILRNQNKENKEDEKNAIDKNTIERKPNFGKQKSE